MQQLAFFKLHTHLQLCQQCNGTFVSNKVSKTTFSHSPPPPTIKTKLASLAANPEKFAMKSFKNRAHRNYVQPSVISSK